MMLINGNPGDCISAMDRGLQYGDGLFESIALQGGRLLLWQRHMDRLRKGCDRLKIIMPDVDLLRDEAIHVCEENATGVLKLIVTRGVGGRGYIVPSVTGTRIEPTRVLAFYDWPDHPEKFSSDGISVRFCHTRLAENRRMAGIKHLNRLEQVLARNEWQDDQFQEGLMLSHHGDVIEGTMSNVFIVVDNVLYTPDLENCGVKGIMRELIMELAVSMSIDVRESGISHQAVMAADEVFICNSIIGVWPVKRIQEKALQVGRVTRAVQKAVIEYREE
ncbi:MAG: aminodeoxychorismate lyase [Gammaproteobacteria bacterium]|nr:MAG: aminodeoxychorismate lyase [Gammaproteobacteria bacterium]